MYAIIFHTCQTPGKWSLILVHSTSIQPSSTLCSPSSTQYTARLLYYLQNLIPAKISTQQFYLPDFLTASSTSTPILTSDAFPWPTASWNWSFCVTSTSYVTGVAYLHWWHALTGAGRIRTAIPASDILQILHQRLQEGASDKFPKPSERPGDNQTIWLPLHCAGLSQSVIWEPREPQKQSDLLRRPLRVVCGYQAR